MQTDSVIAKTVQSLNRHLPKERKRLCDLLNEEHPSIQSKDGSTHRIRRAELEMIAELVPKDRQKKVYLPILIEVCPEFGRGAAKIRGRIYCLLVMELLEKAWKGEDEIIIYRPDVSRLRKFLPTASQYAFFMTTG